MIELYHFWSSVCSVRCRMALEEKGVKWTSRYIDLFKFDQLKPDYLAINPDGVVPTLVHDGAPVRESTIINECIDAAFAGLAHDRPDALFISSGPFFTNRSVQLAHLATRYSIPAISGNRRYPEVGGLMSYGASVTEAHRLAGVYVGRILKGAKPSDLPVVQASKFELVINASTARVLDLEIPAGVLAIADEVIE